MKHIKVSYSKIMPVACVWYMIAFDFHHPAESVCVCMCVHVCLCRLGVLVSACLEERPRSEER